MYSSISKNISYVFKIIFYKIFNLSNSKNLYISIFIKVMVNISNLKKKKVIKRYSEGLNDN